MYYIYILECENHNLYTGITTNIERRFSEHVESNKLGAKYTHAFKPKAIVCAWETSNRSLASKLEFAIKTLSKQQKELLIKDDSYICKFFAPKINHQDFKRLNRP